MTLAPGTRLGPYEVTAQIGVGGMGEVYRATDTKLKRSVAIKVLPASLAGDAERLARFQREAEVLASLNHPNIAHIYGLEDADGVKALVMELVEGTTLADRIAQGAISLGDALPIANQIAEALEAAHEQGIVHRDLKPANIKVRSDGTVKVLDFGLAKAMESPSAMSPSVSQAPTITSPEMMTGVGMILGTAAYMSPEQGRGKPVDRRADIWAFGAVLFEMLTGKRAFAGDDVSEVLASVLAREPDWTRLPAKTPTSIRRLLRRCLEKDRKRRLDSAAAARLELEDAVAMPSQDPTVAAPVPHARLAWTCFAMTFLAAALLALPALRHVRETSAPEIRTEIATPATDEPGSFALSPDGRQIVFAASAEGGSRLWLRSLATTTAEPLAGTESGTLPFWAPDGRAVGFFSDGALKRLDLGSGSLQTLAPVLTAQGGTWGSNGEIVYAPSSTAALMRVSAAGGQATMLGMLGQQEVGHVFPQFLPDGRRFLFYVTGAPSAAGIYLGALDGGASTRLIAASSTALYHASGWVLWVRADALVAQRLDRTRAALSGNPVVLANGLTLGGYRSPISVAASGLIAYRMDTASQSQLTWFDRTGASRGNVGEPDGYLREPSLSPDGRRVVAVRRAQGYGNEDLWLLDGVRASRFTFDAGGERIPVWSRDGGRIVFRKATDLYQKLTSGAGVEELLVASDQLKVPTSWSADGRFLMYHAIESETDADLWVMPTEKDRTPSVFLKTPFREAYGAFSPDGRWVAYQSDESGRPEIYVRPFEPPGAADGGSARRLGSGQAAEATEGQWQVSTNGGIRPLWRHDGRELHYVNPAGAMMATPVTANGATFEPGTPVELFPTRIFGGGTEVQQARQYDVAPDGRFLINTVLPSADTPIILIQNWQPGLPARER